MVAAAPAGAGRREARGELLQRGLRVLQRFALCAEGDIAQTRAAVFHCGPVTEAPTAKASVASGGVARSAAVIAPIPAAPWQPSGGLPMAARCLAPVRRCAAQHHKSVDAHLSGRIIRSDLTKLLNKDGPAKD